MQGARESDLTNDDEHSNYLLQLKRNITFYLHTGEMAIVKYFALRNIYISNCFNLSINNVGTIVRE